MPNEAIELDGHRYIHVAACPCRPSRDDVDRELLTKAANTLNIVAQGASVEQWAMELETIVTGLRLMLND